MPAAQPPRRLSRQALLAEVQALRQRVAILEQEKYDLEVILETMPMISQKPSSKSAMI